RFNEPDWVDRDRMPVATSRWILRLASCDAIVVEFEHQPMSSGKNDQAGASHANFRSRPEGDKATCLDIRSKGYLGYLSFSIGSSRSSKSYSQSSARLFQRSIME